MTHTTEENPARVWIVEAGPSDPAVTLPNIFLRVQFLILAQDQKEMQRLLSQKVGDGPEHWILPGWAVMVRAIESEDRYYLIHREEDDGDPAPVSKGNPNFN